MISYPPTPLLPYRLPFNNYDKIMDHLCSVCLYIQSDDKTPENIKQQHFDLTMELLEFWFNELRSVGLENDY